jgi:Ran GTPase-activating protein (RanGAP) involved in mRNA processing and transport
VTLDAVADSVVKSKTLVCLGMNGSAFSTKQPQPNMPSAEAALVRMVSRSTSLRMLRFSNCQMTPPMTLQLINNGLRFSAGLSRLDISNNNLPTAIGVRLSEYLLEPIQELVQGPDPEAEPEVRQSESAIPHVFLLDISMNAFATPVSVGFSRVLVSYPYLGYLDLSQNLIDDDGIIALAAALKTNKTLVELHLASNRFTSVGGRALADALGANETLTTLNISKNKLGDDTASEVASALRTNKGLQVLLVASASLSNQGGIRLAQASSFCPTLVNIDMSDNFFTEDAGSAMEKLFGENFAILKIDVSGTQINHFSFHRLNEICERNAAMLKQKEQKPLRNQLIKSQYSVVELQRKEAILAALVEQKNELQDQIDALEEQIQGIKNDEEVGINNLAKQVQEKELQMKNDRSDFQEKMKKLDDELKVMTQEKREIESTLESQLTSIKETRAKADDKREQFVKLSAEWDVEKAAKMKEIKEINAAADQLLRLAQDPEALEALEQPPDFLAFPEDLVPEEEPIMQIQEPKGKKGKKKRAPRKKK